MSSSPNGLRVPPRMLPLNPALSPSNNGPNAPRSPLAAKAVSALSLPPSAVPKSPVVSQPAQTAPASPPRKTHLQRVARATREFRDVWIVPE